MTTAASINIVNCEACEQAQRASVDAMNMHCTRCGSTLHFRKPHSIMRTWALVIAAYVLIIPASFTLVPGANVAVI